MNRVQVQIKGETAQAEFSKLLVMNGYCVRLLTVKINNKPVKVVEFWKEDSK